MRRLWRANQSPNVLGTYTIPLILAWHHCAIAAYTHGLVDLSFFVLYRVPMLAAVRQCLPVAMAVLLTVALAANVASAATTPCPFAWNTNLKTGSSGPDVLRLQQFLNTDPATQVAVSGVGSPGSESTTFGAKTKVAVVKFQEKYFNEILGPNGLSKGTGTVGASTRATLNALCGGIHVSSSSPTASSSLSPLQTASAASALP